MKIVLACLGALLISSEIVNAENEYLCMTDWCLAQMDRRVLESESEVNYSTDDSTTQRKLGGVTVISMEGVNENQPVLDFYPGVTFTSNALALVDAEAGGAGGFANEPSPDTIMYFLVGGDVIMNVPGGFTTGFSFYYTSQLPGSAIVYDGLDGTGAVLAELPIVGQWMNNCPDPAITGDSGPWCNWTPVGAEFDGVARSVEFVGNNLRNIAGFDDITLGCATPGNLGGGCNGDPHILRWGQDKRDSFHGECDLVLVSNKNFHQGQGLDVHIRTTIQDFFSYIEAAAVRIGKYTLEFHHDRFLLDSVEHKHESLPLTFGGDQDDGGYEYTMTYTGGKHRNVKINLNDSSSITIRSTKLFMGVSVNGNEKDFGTSVGLMGEYGTGAMHGRDGGLIFDMNDYGMEWQVQQDDPLLFADARAPQWPKEKCRMPSVTSSRRKLRAQSSQLLAEANKACANVSDFDLCVTDVMATGVVELAETF